MIAVDASALVAIVLGEVDAERLAAAIRADVAITGAPTLLEAAIVVEARQGADAARDLQLLVDRAIDDVVAADRDHVESALKAWRRFGKGRHAAALNFGDCLSYAVADVAGVPLLFKGSDFAETDIAAVSF